MGTGLGTQRGPARRIASVSPLSLAPDQARPQRNPESASWSQPSITAGWGK